MPHFAAQVLTVVQRLVLMAVRMLMPADLVLMADQMLYSDLVPMVGQKLRFVRVPRVVQRLDSVERVPRADRTLAVVVDLNQKAAQKHCSAADQELTAGQTLKLDQTLALLAVHFA